MSLKQQQDFLARLYTDEKLRHRFLSEPDKIGLENELTEREASDLALIVPAELETFAESLFWKRLREVEKLLPRTRDAMGVTFARSFREFSRTFRPNAVKRHLQDAIAFVDFVKKNLTGPQVDLARFEQAGLEFNGGGKKFVLRKFDSDVRDFLDPGKGGAFTKRKTIAVWIRLGGKSRHFFI